MTDVEAEKKAAREILSGEADIGEPQPIPEEQPDYITPHEIGLVDGPTVEVSSLTPGEAYIIGRTLARIEEAENE